MTNDPSGRFKDFMNMFDPSNVSKMFDPQALMEQIGVSPASLDPQDTIENVRANFDAMAKANEAAAASYRDLMEKQMQIFRDVTSQATEQLKSGPPEDVAVAYQESVKKALGIMTELSEAVQTANQKAYDTITLQVDSTIKDLKS